VYKPYGIDLHHYDINSLYPYAMLNKMPTGKPYFLTSRLLLNMKITAKKLGLEILDLCFGFLLVEVNCPSTLERPVLPYRLKSGSLIFPTGKFKGVYFSEELKYYRKFGYTFNIIKGYNYDDNSISTPFSDYVTKLYTSRIEAKNLGNSAMDFLYKLLLNSLFGRLGINKTNIKSTMINSERLNDFIQHLDIVSVDEISNNFNLVKYIDSSESNKTLNVACAAAITTYARIKMSDAIVNNDVYYTDTDSIFIKNRLPVDMVDNSRLGYFKEEAFVNEGIFIEPKTYALSTSENKQIVKAKGVGSETFESIKAYYLHQFHEESNVVLPFIRSWRNLQVNVRSIKVSKHHIFDKRLKVLDQNNKWIATLPINID